MSPNADRELNKAALVIAKLLLRTREGKIPWTDATFRGTAYRFSAKLEDNIEATVVRGDGKLSFTLTGPPAVEIPNAGISDIVGLSNSREILSVSLSESFGKEERRTPETIIFRDIDELFQLARNPKSVSDDLRLKQVLSYLDKLAV